MPVNIIIDSKFDDRGVKNAQKQLQQMAGDAAKRVAQVGAAVAAAGAVAAGKLAIDAVNAASDFEESVNAVNVAFGEAAQGVLDIGENAAKSMGLSQNEFNQAATRFSAFAETVVGEGGDVAGFIGDVSQRAADFASVFNIDVSEALQVFQSGLAGEAEPLKRFGINLLQSEVAAYAMANGIATSAASMTEAQKVQARYGLLLQETAKTQGDFQNTSDSLANSQRILKAELENLQIEIGGALIPVAKELVNTFADALIPRLEDFGAWINSPEGIASVTEFGEGLVGVFEAALDFGGWIADNLDLLKGIGIVIASVTAGVYAYRAATVVATIAQAGLNATIALNPFGAIAMAITTVVSALALLALGNKEATPTQEELNTQIEDAEEKLKFYREEQEKATNSSKLYYSNIKNLEAEIIRLKEAQGQNIVFTKESVVQTDKAREAAIRARYANNDLAPAINKTRDAYGEMALQAINAKLGVENVSIAQQAQEIFMQKLAEGVSINAIENGLYASILADVTAKTKYQTQAQVDFNDEVRRAGIRLGLVVPDAEIASGAITGYSGSTSLATESTDELTSSIDGLSTAMDQVEDRSIFTPAQIAEIDGVATKFEELRDVLLMGGEAGRLENQDVAIRGTQGPSVNISQTIRELHAYAEQEGFSSPEQAAQDLFGGSIQDVIDAVEGRSPADGSGLATTEGLFERIEDISSFLDDTPAMAAGGVVTKPTFAMIGEQGHEAVIPLNKLNDMQGGNTYIINVTASNRVGGSQAGEEIVNALKNYNSTNGNFQRQLTGFGS